MLVITSNSTIDLIYHLDLDHVLQLNELPATYNLCVRKKLDTSVKVTSDINYVINQANDHIDRDYHIHVLKEEATNTPSSLLLIPESAIASEASASATVQVANPPPTTEEERESPSIVDSTISTNSEAVLLMEEIQVAQESQMKTNDINTKVLHALMDSEHLKNE